MKDIPWADLLCCDWCKKSFTSLQVCFLRPDMNICPLAFKKKAPMESWSCLSERDRMFCKSVARLLELHLYEREWKQAERSLVSPWRRPADRRLTFLDFPSNNRLLGLCEGEHRGHSVSVSHSVSSHSMENKLLCWNVSAVDGLRQHRFLFQVKSSFPSPQNIHSFMFWNNQHTYLSWFLPSSKGQMIHAVDAFYEEALFPTLGDWKSCCGIRSITGLTLMATEHAGVKFHFSPSLPPTHKWCPLPTPKPQHPPPPLLCSTLCVCCSRDSAESPRCNFLFALSWTETPQRSAERGESALLTGSLPHLSQFLLHLHVLLLLVVLARSRRQVVLLWL